MTPSITPFPIGPVIYTSFDDRGSPSMGLHFEAATPDYLFRFMPVGVGARKLPIQGHCHLEATHLSRSGFTKGSYVIHDEFTVENLDITGGTIVDAKRATIAPTGKPVSIDGIATGTYLYRWGDTDQSIRDQNETIPCGPESKQALQDQANALVTSFCAAFMPTIEDRITRIRRAYPIQAGAFFDYNFTIGTIFREQFNVHPLRSCCDPDGEPGAGFTVRMLTDHFEMEFTYSKHSPGIHHSEGETASLQLSRANIGLLLSLDEKLGIQSIQETGTSNTLLGAHYTSEDFSNPQSLGGQLHERASRIIQELMPLLRFQERAAFCDNLSSKDLELITKRLGFIQRAKTPRDLRMEEFYQKMGMG